MVHTLACSSHRRSTSTPRCSTSLLCGGGKPVVLDVFSFYSPSASARYLLLGNDLLSISFQFGFSNSGDFHISAVGNFLPIVSVGTIRFDYYRRDAHLSSPFLFQFLLMPG